MKLRVLACTLLLLPASAFAWAELGHRLVGELAEQRLTRSAGEQVRQLLAGESAPTLGGVANWADSLRSSDPERFRLTAQWHYINAKGGGCEFVVERDCPDGKCVVAAIEAQRQLLADRTRPPEVRRDALKFLVHLVGDIHQPLHAGSRPDAGGNQFQISLRTDVEPEAYARSSYVDGVMGTNLHAVWDYYILADARLSPARYAARLRTQLPRVSKQRQGTPLDWARESCALIEARRLYPQAHVMARDYLRDLRPLAEQRLALAAVRLAGLLNVALNDRVLRPAPPNVASDGAER